MTRHIYVVHGIRSNAENVEGLRKHLGAGAASATADNYDWRQSVLKSGLDLAARVLRQTEEETLLVGHSQGGLVCRVAAAALSDWTGLATGVENLAVAGPKYKSDAIKALDAFKRSVARGPRLVGVVTLATPNSGAFTFGQLSIGARAVSYGMRYLYSAVNHDHLMDLTTDRLFRILQYARVENVPYLSISGSYANRHRGLSTQDLADLPILDRLGVHLDLPNDNVVEDCSVDMREAVLPTEIARIDDQYTHIRLFTNCGDVTHSGIHETPEVHRRLSEWITQRVDILPPPRPDSRRGPEATTNSP